ncbi:M20 family metallopeptidase [Natrialbaceae archaeon A-CW2]
MELRELTRDLVSIPSHEDETAVGDFLESWLRRETDAVVHRDAAGNVLARRGGPDSIRLDETNASIGDGSDSGRSLALVGHHDVVPPDETQVTRDGEYVLTERDGRLFGRGAADMKGAVAAAAIAFRDCDLETGDGGADGRTGATDAGDTASPELWFASFVGEETGGRGARHAIENGFVPDCAIVGEGSTNYSGPDVTDVAVAHRGRRGSTITARGTAAHASEPEAGENAIYRAGEAIDVIRGLEFPSVEVAGQSMHGSVVATEIEGGSGSNVIPAECTITVDERTVPGVRADLEAVTELPEVEWTVDQDLPPMQCADESFARGVLEAADAAQSGSPELVTKPHATDAGWLAKAGTACVVCGPAEPGEAHTKNESVSMAVLERCLETYRTAAERWIAPS